MKASISENENKDSFLLKSEFQHLEIIFGFGDFMFAHEKDLTSLSFI